MVPQAGNEVLTSFPDPDLRLRLKVRLEQNHIVFKIGEVVL